MSRENGDGQPIESNGNGDGRLPDGTFAQGHKFSRGRRATQQQQLRDTYASAVTQEDLKDIAQAVVKAAKAGDIAAAKEVCDRLLGKSVQQDLLERIEDLEAAREREARR